MPERGRKARGLSGGIGLPAGVLKPPDMDESFSLCGIGQKGAQKRVEACAVIHGPEVTELMAEHVIDERKRHFRKLGGKRDVAAHGTASPAAPEKTHGEGENDGVVAENGSGHGRHAFEASGQHEFCRLEPPAPKCPVRSFGPGVVIGSRAQTGQLQHIADEPRTGMPFPRRAA